MTRDGLLLRDNVYHIRIKLCNNNNYNYNMLQSIETHDIWCMIYYSDI